MTDRDTYARVRALFHELCELPPNERADRLRELGPEDADVRREVERLLESMDGDDPLEGGAAALSGLDAPTPDVPGFRVVGPIGEGGMGVVYEAHQENPARRVALKVIRPGLATDAMTRRFRREAAALARLQHPGIAQVHAVGVGTLAGGRAPYIAMELVEGERLTEHARSRGLSTRERLELGARLCDAVEHAHQRGVIHRDIKPANILVDASGQPKILDFGVARLTEQDVDAVTMRTEPGRIVGTAAYMSPEQASGDPDAVDTRADVYALGVVIYELLTDRLPFDIERLPLPDAIRVIREDTPTRAASIVTSLRGDVDTILSKAIERDKDRRYQSASELAADLRRHLRDEPIVARPPSASYQLRKFARRNKVLVGGIAATMVALAIGLVGTTLALRSESRERARAEEALVRAEAASGFMERILLGLEPRHARGRDTTLVRQMLDDAAAELESGVTHPVVRAEMHAVVGRAYQSIFEYELAIGALGRAVDGFERLGAERWQQQLDEARLVLAEALTQAGDNGRAESLFVRAIESTGRAGDDAGAMHAHRQYAELLMDTGRWDAALEHIGLSEARSQNASDLDLGRIAMMRGAILRRMSRLDEAHASYTESLTRYRASDASLEISKVLNSLAVLARQRGEPDEALRLYEESIELRRSVDPRANPDTAASLSNLGKVLVELGRLGEARAVLARAVSMHHELYKPDQAVIGYPTVGLAQVERELGNNEAALSHFDRAIALFVGEFGDQHPRVVSTLCERAELLRSAGRSSDAERDYRRAIRASADLGLDPAVHLAPIWVGLAEAQADLGDQDDARKSVARALKLAAGDPGVLNQIRVRSAVIGINTE